MNISIVLLSLISLLCPLLCRSHGYGQQSWPNILADLERHADLRQFTQLVRDTELARKYLTYREMTIFAPTDEAFDEFRGRYDRHLVLYHMVPVAMTTVELLQQQQEPPTDGGVQHYESVMEEFPPLWLTQIAIDGGDKKIYVNDAMLITNQTNYSSKSRSDIYGKLQILHKINKVLSPMATTTMSPTAYDFMSQTPSWHLVPYSFHNFYKRVITTKMEHLYKDGSSHTAKTFLIPADEFRTAMEDSEITAAILPCANLPQLVFITPDTIGSNYATLHDSCHITIVNGSVINVRDTMRGLSKQIQVLIANVPLRNGVAHVVRHMPGLFRPKMAPKFPFRSLWEQVNNSWYMHTSTRLLEKVVQHTGANSTWFLPEDSNWEAFVEKNGKTVNDLAAHEDLTKFMHRHMTAEYYDMRRLIDVSRLSLRGQRVILGTGDEKIMATFVEADDGSVRINWGNKVIKVTRANIQCTNGILHVIDSPFIFDGEIGEPKMLVKIWKGLSKIIF